MAPVATGLAAGPGIHTVPAPQKSQSPSYLLILLYLGLRIVELPRLTKQR